MDKKYTEQLQKIFWLVDNILISPGKKIIAIDGNSAAGKSHLAALIAEKYDCNLFHMDDYFLPSVKKTASRLNQVGGNVDLERFKTEIADNIRRDKDFYYKKFDCRTQTLGPRILVSSSKLNIIEGVYSMHPLFAHLYDLKLFLSLDKTEQSRRILTRNGVLMHKQFMENWIPLENHYFAELKIKESCHYIFHT